MLSYSSRQNQLLPMCGLDGTVMSGNLWCFSMGSCGTAIRQEQHEHVPACLQIETLSWHKSWLKYPEAATRAQRQGYVLPVVYPVKTHHAWVKPPAQRLHSWLCCHPGMGHSAPSQLCCIRQDHSKAGCQRSTSRPPQPAWALTRERVEERVR